MTEYPMAKRKMFSETLHCMTDNGMAKRKKGNQKKYRV